MEGIKCVLIVVVMLSVGGVLGKFERNDRHFKRIHEDLSEESVLLRDKLNLILNAESKEVTLLKNLLDEEHDKEVEEKEGMMEGTTEKSGGEVVEGKGSVRYLREHGIVTKLEENSKRMEKMVVFLVDLRNLLTEALTQQNRQMAVESELVEIREEMEYLRKEVQVLKQEGHQHLPPSTSPPNQVKNDHTTLEWLKASSQELRRELTELSDQCNATLLMSLREKLESSEKRREDNFRQAEKTLDMLRLRQMRQQEEVKEAQENIRDLRSWQVKMGSKLVGQLGGGGNEETNEVETGEEMEEQRFLSEALKEAVGKPNLRHQQSHKRLKSKVYQLQQLVNEMSTSNRNHERRLSKLESSQRTLKSLLANTSPSRGRSQRSIASSSGKLQSLEKTMEQYVLTLERLNDKVAGMDELQESNTQLFQSLEQLEKKYDGRVDEIQTAVARLESGVSGVLVTNEDLKEQQTQQSSVIQAVKKDVFGVKGKLQTNHLRLASIQSELVRWASTKCADENSESIQNIRIATLEHALLDQDETTNNELEDEESQEIYQETKRK